MASEVNETPERRSDEIEKNLSDLTAPAQLPEHSIAVPPESASTTRPEEWAKQTGPRLPLWVVWALLALALVSLVLYVLRFV
jgi:hypothetical protein